jgi:hypothetical protein
MPCSMSASSSKEASTWLLCHSAGRSGMVQTTPQPCCCWCQQRRPSTWPVLPWACAKLPVSPFQMCWSILWIWYPGYSLNCLIRSCLWNNLFSIFIISHCSSCRYLFTTLMVGEAKAVLCMSCCPWDPDCHQRRFNTRTYQAGKNSLLSFMLKVVLWLTITLLSLAYSSTFCSNNTCNILMW